MVVVVWVMGVGPMVSTSTVSAQWGRVHPRPNPVVMVSKHHVSSSCARRMAANSQDEVFSRQNILKPKRFGTGKVQAVKYWGAS